MSKKDKLYRIIFESSSRAGRSFDIALMLVIIASVAVVLLDSIPALASTYHDFFYLLEWVFTILFTLEYLIRIIVSPRPGKYLASAWGLVDLAAILPTYISLFLPGYQYLIVIRVFRLLRVFRILKLIRFSREALLLLQALKSSRRKIVIFMTAVLSSMVFMGTLMYVVEGGENGFTSIPHCIYWAVVTITTVGYGDIVPHTAPGKFISSVAMLIGFAVIAVPTGIITVEMSRAAERVKACPACQRNNSPDSSFCDACGRPFPEGKNEPWPRSHDN